MKKIAWFAPILLAGSVAFVACDGGSEDDVDGTGGSDGSGGKASGGNGSGGSTGGAGTTGGTGGQASGGSGGTPSGGAGGLGGMGGMGGMGGESGQLALACEAMCAAGEAGDASECDEDMCVELCVQDGDYYASLECEAEFLELTQCSAELAGDEFFCEQGFVGVTGCLDEQEALVACYD